jgi:hypothetical protein
MRYLVGAIVALIVVLNGTRLSAYPVSGSETSRVKIKSYAFEHDVVMEKAPENSPNFCVIFDERGFWVVLNGQMANLASWHEIDKASQAVRGQ